MGKSGKRTGYRPRTQKQQALDAACAAAEMAAAQRKARLYRYIGIACALLLTIAIVFGIVALVDSCRGNAALSTAHYRVDSEMLTYYFYDYYLAELNESRETYIAAGLDPAKPLDEQRYNGSTTWEEHFLSEVKMSLRRMLVFAEAAYREGTADAAAARRAADECIEALREEADGQPLADYLAARYGVSEATVRRAEELSAIAEARYLTFATETYTIEQRREKYEQDPAAYLAADVIAYSVTVNLSGVSGEDAMRAEYLRAENRAKQIAAAQSEEAFLAAMQADMRGEQPALSDRTIAVRTDDAYMYHIPTAARGLAEECVHEAGRADGDTAVLGETGSYTVVYCIAAPRLVESHRASAQYIFVPYADYLGVAQAQAAAEEILALFYEGAADRTAFAALAAAHGTTGEYLLTSISYGDADKPICDWLLLSQRTAGETAIVAGHEGYYILYFEEYAPLPLWEELVANALREETYSALLAESGLVVYEQACMVPALVPLS